MTSSNEKIPRFVLSITDTQTQITGENGPQHMSISIAADSLTDFTRVIPKADRQNYGKNEFQAMMIFFADQVAKSNINRAEGETKTYDQVEITDQEEKGTDGEA
jgi:hypothetical protein